jgi:hypothetical protein
VSILFGTNVYPAKGDAERRQANGVASLTSLKGVCLVNLCLQGEELVVEGFAESLRLTSDARTLTGRAGPRKPSVSEVFNALAARADEFGLPYFAFVNSDILVSQEAVDVVSARGARAHVFSRFDFDEADGRDLGAMPWGTDLFIIEARWWLANARRFRPYILGEPVWDNVYTSKLLCHAGAILYNREPFIRHEAHPAAWRKSPFAQYVRLLAALDAPYFSLWVEYIERLERSRDAGASEVEEMALQREVFRLRQGVSGAAVQAARGVKARLRYRALDLMSR